MSLEVDIEKKFSTFTLSVKFAAGSETLGFLGASGCGKSLTLRCIAGIETPDRGRIVVNDQVFFDSDQKINLSPQERKTALLFQNYMLFPNLTVAANVAAGIGKDVSKADRDKIVADELKRFSLDGYEKRYPAQLSGGQQQRVALARMLAAKPGILMLDEPFSALDAHLKGVLEQNLVDLFAGFDGTVLYVSHDIDEALRFCDRIAVVDNGKIMEIDTDEELVNDPQSLAALKLSGCRNTPKAARFSDHEIWLPEWGITVHSEQEVPKNIEYLGVRDFNVRQAEGPGPNNFYAVVDRSRDSRFDRTLMMGFLQREEGADPQASKQDGEMGFLRQHLIWRLDEMRVAKEQWPSLGDKVWVHIPEDKLYLITR